MSDLGVGGVDIGVLDPVFQTCLDTVELRLFNFLGDGFEYSFPVLLAADIVFPFLEASLSFDVVKALEVICKHVVRLVRQFALQTTVFPRVSCVAADNLTEILVDPFEFDHFVKLPRLKLISVLERCIFDP